MKIINKVSNSTFGYVDMTVETQFLWWKTRTTYRKIGGEIFEYKGPNNYRILGIIEKINIEPIFKLPFENE